MLCPHCRHSDGWHTAPGERVSGRVALDYECGKCGHATGNDDGTSTPCSCPGWYPGLTVIQMVAETIAARATCSQLADPPPFALTRQVSKRRLVQLKLFQSRP